MARMYAKHPDIPVTSLDLRNGSFQEISNGVFLGQGFLQRCLWKHASVSWPLGEISGPSKDRSLRALKLPRHP